MLIIPIVVWRLNYLTNKKVEEVKRQTDLKIKTYSKIFQTFNPILAHVKSDKTLLDRIDMTNVDMQIIYNDILLAIRKDLGYKDTLITPKDITEMLVSK